MKVFTPSAMTRPLFEEPSPGCERADPWSGPKGFMIGGMSRSTLQNLGQQYFVAANLLVEAIKRDELEDYKLVNPVLYLYRHWLEVTLKSLISSASDEHDLRRLAEQFGAIAHNNLVRRSHHGLSHGLRRLPQLIQTLRLSAMVKITTSFSSVAFQLMVRFT